MFDSKNKFWSIGYDFTDDFSVFKMSDTSISLSTYATMIPAECEEIGFTSSGYYDVFKTEAGAGFFSAGATITLK